MVPILNQLNVTIGCYGNHDFDFGIEQLSTLNRACNFPFLLSNLKAADGTNLSRSIEIFEFITEDIKVLYLGLVESDWIETMSVHSRLMKYESYLDCAKRLIDQQTAHTKYDYIIALSHMRNKNDRELMAHEPRIDLILGGHDHVFYHDFNPSTETLCVKSGTDFREYSIVYLSKTGTDQTALFHKFASLQMEPSFEKYYESDVWSHTLTVQYPHSGMEMRLFHYPIRVNQPHDPHVLEMVTKSTRELEALYNRPLFTVGADVVLNIRFVDIRTKQSNILVLLNTLLKLYVDVKIAKMGVQLNYLLMNCGTYRLDRDVTSTFLYGDMFNMLPYEDELLIIEMYGRDVVLTFENGVSKVPSYDGRYPSLIGAKFTYNSQKEPGERILRDSLYNLDGSRIEADKLYYLCVKGFIHSGKDGYETMNRTKVVIDNNTMGTYRNTILHILQMIKDQYTEGRLDEQIEEYKSFYQYANRCFHMKDGMLHLFNDDWEELIINLSQEQDM